MARPVATRGTGRERVLDAALRLFSTHGVSGTSLQMIAAALGVTKAAVYYQFHAKEDIVVAVLEPAFDEMETFIAHAEVARGRRAQLEAALAGLVDIAVSRQRLAALIGGDPAMSVVVRSHERFRHLVDRLDRVLVGPEPTAAQRMAVSMLGGGLLMTGADARLADLDEETRRTEMLRILRAVLLPPLG